MMRFPEQVAPGGARSAWLALFIILLGATTTEILYSIIEGRPWPFDSTNLTSWSYYIKGGAIAAPFRIGAALLSVVGIVPLGWQVYTLIRLAMTPYSCSHAYFTSCYAQAGVIATCDFIVLGGFSLYRSVALCFSLMVVGAVHFVFLRIRSKRADQN
jgi:hypothetical protein